MSVVYHIVFRFLFVYRLVVVNLAKDFEVDRDWVLADVDSVVVSNLDLLEPRMSSDPFYRESFFGVRAQNFSDQVLAGVTHEFRNIILCIQYFLI